jgi:hypothetical protein
MSVLGHGPEADIGSAIQLPRRRAPIVLGTTMPNAFGFPLQGSAAVSDRAQLRRMSGSVSARVSLQAALLEVLNASTVNFNPSMFRLLENRSSGGRIFWVRDRPDSDGDRRWKIV